MSSFIIGPYRLDAARKILTLDGEPLRLGSKAVEVLIALLERPGEVVTKDEILARVWPEGFVEEANLSQNVYMLRRALQEHWATPTITTVHGRGYRFVAPVEALESRSEPPLARRRFPWVQVAIAAATLIAVVSIIIFTNWKPTPAQPLSQEGRQYLTIAQYDLNLRELFQSVVYFARVVKTDPRSPLGDAGMAEAYAMMPDYGLRSAAGAQADAFAHASAALQLDPNSPQAIAVLGFLKIRRTGDPTAGIPELRRSLALDPSDPLPHEWLGVSLFQIGQMKNAQKQLEIAQQLDPISPVGQIWLGAAYLAQRRYADAIDHIRRGVNLNPRYKQAYELLSIAYTESGNNALALASVAAFTKLCSCATHAAALRAFVLAHASSTRTQAYAELQKVVHAPDADPEDVAYAYIALGDRTRALSWLRRVELRTSTERANLAIDPRLDPVRSDARFKFWTHPTISMSVSSTK